MLVKAKELIKLFFFELLQEAAVLIEPGKNSENMFAVSLSQGRALAVAVPAVWKLFLAEIYHRVTGIITLVRTREADVLGSHVVDLHVLRDELAGKSTSCLEPIYGLFREVFYLHVTTGKT
jgi:hypothetical protein